MPNSQTKAPARSTNGFSGIFDIDTVNFHGLSNEQFKKETVKNWSKAPCGSLYSDKKYQSKEYFEEIEKHRYSTHPWILEAINSFPIEKKKVLEIGFGMGTDHLSMARKGANLYGVDLTPRNHEVTRARFDLYGFKPRIFLGDAENLSIPDGKMDFVYSFGVVHHSPNTESAIKEIFRVLKPEGKCYVTVYHKHSAFFWWNVYLVNYILKKGWQKRTLRQQLSLIEYPNDNENLVIRLYKKKEFGNLFNQFRFVKTYIRQCLPADFVHLNRFHKNPTLPTPFFSRLGKIIGWYIVVEATK